MKASERIRMFAGVFLFAAFGTGIGLMAAQWLPSIGPLSGNSLGFGIGFLISFALISRFIPKAFGQERRGWTRNLKLS